MCRWVGASRTARSARAPTPRSPTSVRRRAPAAPAVAACTARRTGAGRQLRVVTGAPGPRRGEGSDVQRLEQVGERVGRWFPLIVIDSVLAGYWSRRTAAAKRDPVPTNGPSVG